MKLLNQLWLIISAMKRIALAIQSSIDLADVLFFGGLLLFGYGLDTIFPRLGTALVGLLLVIYVRPIKAWWAK